MRPVLFRWIKQTNILGISPEFIHGVGKFVDILSYNSPKFFDWEIIKSDTGIAESDHRLVFNRLEPDNLFCFFSSRFLSLEYADSSISVTFFFSSVNSR